MSNPVGTTQTQSNLETLQKYWAAMDHYNIDAALQTLDANCIIHIPDSLPYGGTYQGHDEIRQFWNSGFYELPTAASAEQWVSVASSKKFASSLPCAGNQK